ncbi:MAG: hypothetical protein U5K53_11095 [Halanaerobiales bacterium]|nr:hypothetical protein [Halanaerobiales bacterium]
MSFVDFNAQNQSRLKDLANKYGSTQNNLLDMILTDNSYNSDANNLSFNPSNKFSINLGLNEEQTYDLGNNMTGVQLNYILDDNTLINAEYEVENRYEYDREQNEMISSSNLDSRFGIRYQTTDNIQLFGDYVYNNILEETGRTTVFGLEYNNYDSIISAEYRVGDDRTIDGEAANSTQYGVTYRYSDLASFSASYKLLDKDQLEDLKEQEWDFGVGFNLNEQTSFQMGVQLYNQVSTEIFNNDDSENDDESSDDSNDNNNISTDTEKETKVEASFQIKF